MSHCRKKVTSLRRRSRKFPRTWKSGTDGVKTREYEHQSSTELTWPWKSMTVGPVTVHVEYNMQLVERKETNKNEKNITRCCWTPNQWGRDILYIFINWIQLNFLYIAPNHKHRLRQEYPSVGTSKKVITDVSLKYKYRYIYMPLPSQRSRGPQPEICSAAVSEQVRLEQVSRSELSTAPYSCKPPEMRV